MGFKGLPSRSFKGHSRSFKGHSIFLAPSLQETQFWELSGSRDPIYSGENH